MVPYPGTRVYEMARRGEGGYQLLSECWSDYDKYGGRALELRHLRYEDMEKLQQSAYLRLYLRNLRLLDLAGFLWMRRKAIFYLLRKRLLGRRWKGSGAERESRPSEPSPAAEGSSESPGIRVATEVRSYTKDRPGRRAGGERLRADHAAKE
jgi:hypothetical protein